MQQRTMFARLRVPHDSIQYRRRLLKETLLRMPLEQERLHFAHCKNNTSPGHSQNVLTNSVHWAAPLHQRSEGDDLERQTRKKLGGQRSVLCRILGRRDDTYSQEEAGAAEDAGRFESRRGLCRHMGSQWPSFEQEAGIAEAEG